MRMLRSFVNEKITEQLCSQTIFWQHALHGVLNYCQRFAIQQLLRSGKSLSAGIPGVTNVHLVSQLLAVRRTFVALTIITLSPQSTCGV